jgi:hypothetical protein
MPVHKDQSGEEKGRESDGLRKTGGWHQVRDNPKQSDAEQDPSTHGQQQTAETPKPHQLNAAHGSEKVKEKKPRQYGHPENF